MKNVGKTDRIIRVVLGFILVAAAVILQISIGRLWWIGILGLIMLGTSALSFCPLYIPFKINTRSN